MHTNRSYIFLVSGIKIPQQPIQIDSKDYFTNTKDIKINFTWVIVIV